MKIKLSLLPIAAAVVLLTGCGDDNEQEPTEIDMQLEAETVENSQNEQANPKSDGHTMSVATINPEEYPQTGNTDTEAAVIAADYLKAADGATLSKYKVFERMIDPIAEDGFDAFHPVTAANTVAGINDGWVENAVNYVTEYAPMGDDAKTIALEVLMDSTLGAFEEDVAKEAVNIIYKE